MMLPLIYPLLRSNPTVLSIVGDRIGRHGSMTQDEARPYITWFLVNGAPENQLSGAPCVDVDTVQIDCYSMDDTQVETLAYAVRDALDQAGHLNRIVRNLRDPDTRLYLISIETDIIRPR